MNKNNIEIIAEIGINHNGSISLAKELINASNESKVSAIKFQYRNLGRCYINNNKEIGDEILENEIEKNSLSVDDLLELTNYAHNLNLQVGISFFTNEDIADFSKNINIFDFFKIPSPEACNEKLINEILSLKKDVFISTGAQKEFDLSKMFKNLEGDNWYPFHCVSNYPTESFNSNLGYIRYLEKKWNRHVGYSSHDTYWINCIAAISFGAKWIERHITIDKKMQGLDHTSSSTPEEFRQMSDFAKSFKYLKKGNAGKTPNQGELMNLQNLGRSYYFNKNMNKGDVLNWNNLVYRSPSVGISEHTIKKYIGKSLLIPSKEGQPVTRNFFKKRIKLSKKYIDFVNNNKISLPVRLHDLSKVKDSFKSNFFELHLSFGELESEIDYNLFNEDDTYSIHLPDYISANELIDPFSHIDKVKSKSLDIVTKVKLIADKLFDLTKKKIPVVTSLSQYNQSDDISVFYKNCKDLTTKFDSKSSFLTLQILPPFAWYFGGSVSIDTFSSYNGWILSNKKNISLTMDLSHLMMSCNYNGYNLNRMLSLLLTKTKHIHLSLGNGFDGEGVGFANLTDEDKTVVQKCINTKYIKVIEVWQGHLNDFNGFSKAIKQLYNLFN